MSKTYIGNDRWSQDNPRAAIERNCEVCTEAKLWLRIRWGEIDEYCPICKKKTPQYYKPNGAFIVNHCMVCHRASVEDKETLASACRKI